MNIREQVAQRIAEAGPAIAERIVAAMAEDLLAKRVKQVLDAFSEVDGLKVQVKRLRPDLISFDENGAIASSAYSKARVEERQKLARRIGKIEAALAKALERNDFADLASLGAGKDPKVQEDGADDAD
jgi:uncharacterized protein YdaU (DUF1376 family)